MYKKIRLLISQYFYKKSKKKNRRFNKELSLLDIKKYYTKKKDIYLYFHKYFWNNCSEDIRAHREYFVTENRGFGEDAFHSMWYFIFKRIFTKSCFGNWNL